MEISEICRACLATQGDIVPLDDNIVVNYNSLTNLDITITDEMPHFVCQTCLDTINMFMNFREKAICSHITLKKFFSEKVKIETEAAVKLGSENTDLECSNIKFELKQESYDESEYFDMDNEALNYGNQDDLLCSVDKNNDLEPKRSKRVANKNKMLKLAAKDKNSVVQECLSDIKPKQGIKKSSNRKSQKIIKEDVNVKELFCGLCPETFKNFDGLKNHVDTHEKDDNCLLCKEFFTTRQQTFAHRIVHVPIKQQRCHLCNKKYITTVSLQCHYMSIHYGEVASVICQFCLRSYQSLRKLRSHIWSSHSKEFRCDICSKSFKTKSYLRKHITTHNSTGNYFCDQCEFSSKLQSGLKTHQIRKHNDQKATCDRCRRVFENKEKHDKHKCLLVGLICSTCGKSCKNKQLMKRHMESHSDILRHACPRCPAKFKTGGALKTHIYRHDGIKPYQCEYCQRKFYSGSVLIKHRRIHTGEKPYVCKVCHKGFTGNNNLKLHMRVHGEYLIVKKDKLPDSDTSLELPAKNNNKKIDLL